MSDFDYSFLKNVVQPESYNQLSKSFDMIAVVEDEIGKACLAFPDRWKLVWNSFSMFQDDAGIFIDYDLKLWRAHVKEILGRVAVPPSTKEMRNLGTDAEAIIAFSRVSLVTPIRRDAACAFIQLFNTVFGDDFIRGYALKFKVTDIAEEYPGAAQEMIDQAKRQMSKPRQYPTSEDVPSRVISIFEKDPAQLTLF